MKKATIAIVMLLGGATSAAAQYQGYGNGTGGYGTGSNSSSHSTNGYITNQGTFVQPHYSTNPNSTQTDNYGSRGNYNPYTGQTGTRTPRY